MEEKIKAIVLKYFQEDTIDSAKLFGTKAIVTIKSAPSDEIAAQIKSEILEIDGVEKANIIFTGEKSAVSLSNKPAKWQINGIKKVIAVASGKGGVGKSTTSVNIALALSRQGLNVALFDADIYGPSIPTMLGYEGVAPISYDGKTFQPFEFKNVQSMSIGTLIPKDQPLIWRGAKAGGAIEQLLTETNWQEVDVMVLDMPPGTGDIQLTIAQNLNVDGAVIVSTPQDIALIDAIKGVNMFRKVNIPILGIVENMSYYICEHCGQRTEIFGHAGAKKAAQDLNVNFLGEIPLHFDIRSLSDAGTPIVISKPDSPYTKAYLDIAEKIKEKIGL